MNFGIYISKGNNKGKGLVFGKYVLTGQDLLFLEGVLGAGAKETAKSSSKDRLTANFSSYFLARFLGFKAAFFFIHTKLQKKLDRRLFAHQSTYEYSLREGITNEQWLKIKASVKQGEHLPFMVSIKELCNNVT